MIRAGSPSFVDREAELSFLRRRVRLGRQVGIQVVLVTGEAGVGKTRLCREFIVEQRELGALTLEGSAMSVAHDFLGPVAVSLRDGGRRQPKLRAAVRSRASCLRQLLPELGRPAPGEPSQGRLLVFDSVLEALTEAAADSVVVWLLDDMQWASLETWAFVRQASRARSSPLLLLVTLRPEEMDPGDTARKHLADLQHQAEVAHIHLQPLGTEETESLVRASARGDIPESRVSTIVEWSGGNPGIAEQLAAAEPDEDVRVPESVRLRLQQHLSELQVESRRLMEVAAVMGEESSPDHVLSLVGEADEAHLEHLLQAGFLAVERSGEVDSLRFRHPIFRQAAYELLPWSRRRQIHLQVARRLMSAQQPEVQQRAAHHMEMGGRPEAAVLQLLDAATQARERGEADSATELDIAAVGLTDRRVELAADRDAVLIQTVKNLGQAGKWSKLVPLARQAWSRRHQLNPAAAGEITAMLALGLLMTGRGAEAHSLLLLEPVRQMPAWQQGDVQRWLVMGAIMAADDGPMDAAADFLEKAAQSNDPGIDEWARCLSLALGFKPDTDRQLMAAEFEELAVSAGGRRSALEAFALWNRARMTVQLSDAIRAEIVANQTAQCVRAPARLLSATLHLLEGRPEQAANVLGQARAETEPSTYLVSQLLDLLELQIYLHLGDFDNARALLTSLTGAPSSAHRLISGVTAAAGGWLAWEEGDPEAAAARLQQASRLSLEVGYGLHQLGPIMLPLQVDALLHTGRQREAEQAVATAAATCEAPDRFFRAALSAARLRLKPSHESALRAQEEAGHARWPWLQALILCWRADWFQSEEAARAALDRFTSIGARTGAARAQAVLRRITGRGRGMRSGVAPVDLSKRELTIAELVAQGMTNPQIAAHLFLSSATVTAHVKHILAKLGFSSRAQIAAWFASNPGRAALGREASLDLGIEAVDAAGDDSASEAAS
jgi:DNA-binding CsgD family transcriptional regulator